MKKLLLKKFNSNNAFMGPTHAMSGVAAFLVIAAFLPELFNKLLPSENYFLYLGALILMTGAALLPDFDNTTSTAISVLGIVGHTLSTAMRAIARVVYSATRSKYDKTGADPHRGFWHTILAGVSIGGLAYLALTSTKFISMELFDRTLTLSHLLLAVFLTIGTQLVFAIFFKKFIKQLPMGRLVGWAIGAALSLTIVVNIPADINYMWVWFAISAGWITHILGDTLTTAGTPLLAPLPIKGHRWWNVRVPPHVKANGPIEHYIFMPLFVLITLVSLAKLFIG